MMRQHIWLKLFVLNGDAAGGASARAGRWTSTPGSPRWSHDAVAAAAAAAAGSSRRSSVPGLGTGHERPGSDGRVGKVQAPCSTSAVQLQFEHQQQQHPASGQQIEVEVLAWVNAILCVKGRRSFRSLEDPRLGDGQVCTHGQCVTADNLNLAVCNFEEVMNRRALNQPTINMQVLLQLLSSISPSSVNPSMVLPGVTAAEREANAK